MKQSLGANTFVGATTVWVVGTYDKEGRPNMMTAAWGGVCCSDPPCIGVSLRKATYSYAAVMERKAFTVSIPPADHAKETDFVGIVSGRDVDKWQAANLTPERSQLVDAPYVAEFPLVLECRLLHALDLGSTPVLSDKSWTSRPRNRRSTRTGASTSRRWTRSSISSGIASTTGSALIWGKRTP